jgi:DNA replication protein DnaC
LFVLTLGHSRKSVRLLVFRSSTRVWAELHEKAFRRLGGVTRTLLTSNRPVEDWGKLLGDVAAVSAMLDRLLHHGHVLKCGPRSWRTKTAPAS